MLAIKTTMINAILFSFLMTGCNNAENGGGGEFKTTENGLKYKILLDEEGPNAEAGQYLTFDMVLTKDEDSVISSTYESGQPVQTQVQEAAFKGAIEEGLFMMSAGDSATFLVATDSLFKGREDNKPPFLANAKYLGYRIKMHKIQTMEELQADMDKAREEQKSIDDQLIQDYLKENNLEAERTESGLYYRTLEKGNGEFPTIQDQVTVHYTGKLLNGTTFDSSIPENMPSKNLSGEPVTFPLANVVQGWQEGIPYVDKGGKIELYIPSGMAYGEQSPSPLIPGNAVLVFEVELKDIQKR